MQLNEVIAFLESKAPPSLQEDYDNSGLLTGSPEMDVQGILVCLDSTEEIVEEAVRLGCNVVVAHHPIVFGGLKRITGKNYVERTVLRAIREGIALYAIHTNLDHVHTGVNRRIAEQIGLGGIRILEPRTGQLCKFVVYGPRDVIQPVREAIFLAGGGQIGAYDECSFMHPGKGSFRASEEAHPVIGARGERAEPDEYRLEVLVPRWKVAEVLASARASHSYDEMAYDIYPLENVHQEVGAGMIGELPVPMRAEAFLHHLKQCMGAQVVRHTRLCREEVRRIAVCGGSGSFLLGKAISQDADVLVSADFRYHQFFDADGRIIVADIGHYESERYTIDLLAGWLSEKFRTFATHKTGVVTNPVNYL